MVSTEEILITMLAKDDASDVINQVADNAQSSLSGISSSSGGAISTFDNIRGTVQQLNTGIMGLSSASGMLFDELGAQKSASEYVYGTSSAEDTNKQLLIGMEDSAEQGESMLNTIDKATDNALVSMQDLIPALNTIQKGTGATGQTMEDVSGQVAQFGSFVLAQTGSIQLANTAMEALEKGLNGSYQILRHYGITEENLLNTGLWSGEADDVQGFMDAVTEIIGPMDGLMGTSAGLDAQMGKMWSRAGKQIGRELLPYTKSLKSDFLALDSSMGGQLSKNLLLVQFGIETVQSKLYEFSAFMEAFDDINAGWEAMRKMIGGVGQTATQSAQAVGNLAETSANVSQMATDVGAMGTGMASTGAQSISSGGEVVGEVSGLGLDYYQELREQNPGMKLAPHRNEFDAVRESIDLDLDKIGSFDDLLTNYDNQIDELKDNIRYVTEAEDFSQAVNIGGRTEYVQSQSNRKALDYYQNLLEEKVTEKNAIKELVEQAKSDGDTRDELEIFKELTTSSFMDDIDPSQIDIDDEATKTLSQAIRQKFSNFRQSIGSALKSVKNIPSAIGGKISSVKSSITGIVDKFNEIKADGLSGAIGRLDKALYNPFRKTSNVAEAVAGAETMAEGVGAVAESSTVIGAESATMGAVAPAVEAGAVGTEATAVAETSLSGAFMSMIVPTLAIAGVVAILIPIVAGLVMEALFFIQLIGQFMTALDFDSIDVDGVSQKLQDLALAMAWIGVAMASMSFASFMTSIAFVLTGFGQVQGVLGQAVDMINKAVTEVNKLSSSSQIDESIVTNLNNLGNALNSISMAMGSMMGVTLTTFIGNILTLGGQFGSLSSNLASAKNDLQKAIDTINSMDFGGIDESKVQQISTVMEAIGNFGSAFDGLLKIRDGAKWSEITNMLLDGIFGTSTESVQQAFQNAHEDIKMASQELQYYNDLETVDEETAQKIKAVSDALTSIAEAMENLAKLKEDKGFMGAIDSFLNGSNDDLLGGLENARVMMFQVAEKVATLKDISNIDPLVAEKLESLTTSLDTISNALGKMNDIKSIDGDKGNLLKLAGTINNAKQTMFRVSASVATLKDISNIDPLVREKLTELSSTLEEVNNALTQISTVNTTTGGWNFKGLDTKYTGISHTISSFAFQLNGLQKNLNDGSHQVDSGTLSTQLNDIGTVASSLSTALNPLNQIPRVSRSIIGLNVQYAVQTVNNVSTYLSQLKNAKDVGSDLTSKVNNIGSGATALSNNVKKLIGFPKVSRSIIGLNVQHAVQTVQNVAKYLRQLTSKDKVGTNITSILTDVSNAVTKLKTTLDKMNFNPQGKTIGTSLKGGIKTGLNGLSTTVSTQVTNGTRGAQSSGWTGGAGIGGKAKDGFKSAFKISDVAKSELDYAVQQLNNNAGSLYDTVRDIAEKAVQEAKDTVDQHSPGRIARMFGDEMVYSSMLMEQEGSGLIRTARVTASGVVNAFNTGSSLTPKLMNMSSIQSDLNKAQVQTMMELKRPSNMGKTQRPVNITVGEGAVQLDARNMTRKESRQIMINALEGLDGITGVDVDKTI